MAGSPTEFDRPIFKRLAHNDTGQAPGHQAGFVIPKDLDLYFPQLATQVTPIAPAPGIEISAVLFEGVNFLGEVQTRYQYQTWGGVRSPERRITGNLARLRDLAHAGDFLLIERGLLDSNRYRLTLLRQNAPMLAQFQPLINGRRWGPVFLTDRPSSETEAVDALEHQEQREAQPFQLFQPEAPIIESRSKRIARSRAFQRRICQLYEMRCTFCGKAYTQPGGRSEAEAAHIVPRYLRGSDDARNGLLLCKSHHWAFDYGLVGVAANGLLIVPAVVLADPRNQTLGALQGAPLRAPVDAAFAPNGDALLWHRQNLLIG